MTACQAAKASPFTWRPSLLQPRIRDARQNLQTALSIRPHAAYHSPEALISTLPATLLEATEARHTSLGRPPQPNLTGVNFLDPHRDFGPLVDEVSGLWQGLPDKPEETPVTALRALWFCAGSQAQSCELAATGELPALSAAQAARLRTLIELKQLGVPVAYLTQRQRFMGLELLAGPEALIPRKETEILAQAAIDKIRESVAVSRSATVLDICTGCGNLPLAYLAHAPGCRVLASDISAAAVGLAQRNAEHLGMGHVAEFRCGDFLTPFDTMEFIDHVDVLTCNPPYISTAKVARMPHEISGFEPSLAFDGGPLGVSVLMRLVSEAPRFLKPGAWLGFEVGGGQGPAMVRLLARSGAFVDVQTFPDSTDQIRAVFARTHR
jgi:release factor glutamine methyltransferase